MLNAHSQIHCGPELTFFRDFFGDYRDDPLRHLRFTATARDLVPEPDALEVLGGAVIELHERAARRFGKVRWADKSPDNVLYAERWDRLLEGRVLFVHVVRNPLDTVSSMCGRFPLTLPPDLEGLCEHYRRYTLAGLSLATAYPTRSIRIAYEDICRRPGETLGALMRFLGEELEVAQLEFNKHLHQTGLEDPNVAHAESAHTESIGRWRSMLSDDEVALVRARTDDLASEIGLNEGS
jgi:hypothetical protein